MIRQLFALLETASGHAVDPAYDLSIQKEWRDRAALLLPEGPRYVGIAPGAGGAHKGWPLNRFEALARAEIERGRAAAFLLGPDEAGWHMGLREAVPRARFPLQEDSGPPSPLLTIAVAQRLAGAVANDSGTGHLIAAAGCPLVSLFGPTRAEKFAPAARRLEIVAAQDFGADAMEAIPLDAVGAALERIVAEPGAAGRSR